MYSDNTANNFLSLLRYAQITGLDPVQFFQGQTTLRSRQHCDDVWYEFSWQDSGKVSREELRNAITQAESDLVSQVGYFLAPNWYTETVDYPQFYQREYRGVSGFQASGFNHKTVRSKYGYLISGGIRATSQIPDATITRGNDIDTDGDTFNDTAVFTITGIDFDVCELKAYFKVYDDMDAENCRTDPGSIGADDYWQIQPIRAILSANTATVYIPIYLLFKPQLQRGINAEIIDADDTDSYVDTVEFYRVYNDPSNQGTFLWASEAHCTTTACAWATQSACLRKNDDRIGLFSVSPGTYDTVSQTYTAGCFTQSREPDKVILSYYSGYREPNTRNCDNLSYFWAETIAMLATARLSKHICLCENAARTLVRWQEDVALSNSVRTYNIADLSNPFGTRMGEYLAWQRIKNLGIKVNRNIKTYW